MKGLIFDIRRFSVHDGPGIRTTVFFKGCPLSCWWCHNPESRDFKPEITLRKRILDGKTSFAKETTGDWVESGVLLNELLKDRIFFDESDGGVTFSGGEPLFQEEFLLTVTEECKRRGIHVTVDTSGFAPRETISRVAKNTDLFLYDLKLVDNEEHVKYTGVSNDLVLDNLKFLSRSGKLIVLRFPVIPGITDTDTNIRRLRSFLADELKPVSNFRISLLPYHSMAKEKYKRFLKVNLMKNIPDLTPENLLPLQAELEQTGVQVTIGN